MAVKSMETFELLNQLEDLVDDGHTAPFTNRKLVDVAEMKRVLARIRATLPGELEDARQIRERGHGIVSEAVSTADRIRTAVERESRAMIDETAVVQAAKVRAEEIIDQARKQAEAVLDDADDEADDRRDQADSYARDTLSNFQERLQELQAGLGQLEVQAGHGIEVYDSRERTRAAQTA